MTDRRTPHHGSSPGKPEDDSRKITYRVGWKSGTIHTQDKGGKPRQATVAGMPSDVAPGEASKPARSTAAAPDAEASAERTTAERIASLLLRPAPLPTAQAWTYVLAALPAAAFVALVWLAYRMTAI